MKFFFIAMQSALLTGIFPGADVNQKVLRAFRETFPEARDVQWQAMSAGYVAQFSENGIRTIVNYDADGHFLEATRYYEKENLPMNIVCKIKRKYPAMTLYGVTEICTTEATDYYVKLEDQVNWLVVRSDEKGDLKVVEKYARQR